MAFRITYSVLDADMKELNKSFDETLVKLKRGGDFPSWIGGEPYCAESSKWIEKKNPANHNELLGRFAVIPVSELDHVMTIAAEAQKSWAKRPWQERVAIMRRAADLISERRMELAVVMTLEIGKNRIEALGDAEEAADLLRYYASQVEESNGFLKPLGRLLPSEDTRSVLKPYGVFAVMAPFNFPMALSTGMSGAALVAGNAVVLKPSQDAPWTGQKLYECLNDAGVPAGVFQLVHGDGAALPQALVRHAKTDGVAFTGSHQVGMEILHALSSRFPKPCLMEMSGKNPAIVCESADLAKAIEGCARSAFGLSGQKCSALSRVYVHNKVKDAFLRGLAEKTKTLKIGNPALVDTFVGPVINARAVERHLSAIAEAKRDGRIVFGGEDIRHLPDFKDGHYAQPTIAELPLNHRLFRDELFIPFLVVAGVNSLDEAIAESNSALYGLTAGIFSEDKNEVETFMEQMQSGILYANRKTGATTGAWPGVQSFCGWKGSGSSGKGGCGPYYVSQFVREQSQTRMLD